MVAFRLLRGDTIEDVKGWAYSIPTVVMKEAEPLDGARVAGHITGCDII